VVREKERGEEYKNATDPLVYSRPLILIRKKRGKEKGEEGEGGLSRSAGRGAVTPSVNTSSGAVE